MTDAWDPFDKLRDRIKEAVEPLGVDFVNWALLPGSEPGEPKMCQIVFAVGPNAFEVIAAEERAATQTDEERMFDAQFASMAAAERQRELDEKNEKTKRGLLNLRNGILDDDQDDGCPRGGGEGP